MENFGSTSFIEPVELGIVLKRPIEFDDPEFAEKVDLCFSVEPVILQRLGPHPRIVKYLGLQGRGILLGQASHGNLQAYLDRNPSIRLEQRLLWCHQITEAIVHIHSRGVVHSDLRPRNILVHETRPGFLNLLLCDFGGSTCDEMGLDGRTLPDGPFYHPFFGLSSTPALDIFGLGSLFYTILNGCWPYRTSPGAPETIDEKVDYELKISEKFSQNIYPDLSNMIAARIIRSCWMQQYGTAEEVLQDLRHDFPIPHENETEVIPMFLRITIPLAILVVSIYAVRQRLR